MAGPARTTLREIATRVRTIIEENDPGDLAAAARRLGLSVIDLRNLEEVLERRTAHGRAVLLASVVRAYRADACWLLTGLDASSIVRLPPTVRLEVAQLLSDIGGRILAEHRKADPKADPTAPTSGSHDAATREQGAQPPRRGA